MNLISVVIGISLLALITSAGVSYINPNAEKTASATALVSSGFQTLAQAYQSRQITGAPSPEVATWKGALFPAYGFEPKPPDGSSWSYGASSSGRWFCLWVPAATASMRTALSAVAKNYSSSSFAVSDKCGATPETTSAQSSTAKTVGGSQTISVSGNSVAATLWVTRE